MIDIAALDAQLRIMADELGRQATVSHGRLARALALLRSGTSARERLAERLDAYLAQPEPPWLVGTPAEPLGDTRPLPPHDGPHTVVATDGSQLTPSHHEIALCYVINVGRILYTYGTGEPPVQDSAPLLFHREAELRPLVGRRHGAVNEATVAARRDAHERRALVELAARAVERGHPALALVDGALIPWALEAQPGPARQAALETHLGALGELRALGVPVAGYVSNSRSADVVNMLRLVACPMSEVACDRCPSPPPCEAGHTPLGDRRLWEAMLAPGARSPLFESHARVMEAYGEHRVHFFYLHVGNEVARVEVPAWVAEKPVWLERVHALAYDQAVKGRGYPIALAEAHHRAVVTREDRERFFALLAARLAEAGVPVAVSHKALRKRVGHV